MAADHLLQQYSLRRRLADLLAQDSPALAHAWLDRLAIPPQTDDYTAVRTQAQAFLATLGFAFASDDNGAPLTDQQDITLARIFPRVYRVQALVLLAQIIAETLAAQGFEQVSFPELFTVFSQSFAAIPVDLAGVELFSERLGRLHKFAWSLGGLHDDAAILETVLQDTPDLMGAVDCAFWRWDSEHNLPSAVHTQDGIQEDLTLPSSLLGLLRQVEQGGCVFSIDPGESDPDWPLEMHGHVVGFIPLKGQEGSLGLLSIRHTAGCRFSHDDIFLLSALGSQVAMAMVNAKMHAYERMLVSLLQRSILQMVEATGSGAAGREEFITSLMQVAVGLTHADAICVAMELDGALTVTSAGALAPRLAAGLQIYSKHLLAHRHAGSARPVPLPALFPPHMTWAEIRLDGQFAGIIFALRATPFTAEQDSFLHTVATQIGVGCVNMQRAENYQRMILNLDRINYVSREITQSFALTHIFQVVSLVVSQTLMSPIAFCGWFQEDGTIAVDPDTVIGLIPEHVALLKLNDLNPMVQQVLAQRAPISNRQVKVASFKHLGFRNWLCAPMIVQGRIRGILVVADRAPRPYSVQDIALLTTYANQVSLAMTNALLYTEVEQQYRQMDHLYRLSRTFSAAPDEATLLHLLTVLSAEALQAPVALACLADEAGRLTLTSAHGLPLPAPAVCWNAGEGIVGRVAQTGKPLDSGNLLADGRDAPLHALAQQEPPLVAALAVPLTFNDTALGTLVVTGHTARLYTPAEQQLLQAIANDAALALYSLRLRGMAASRSTELQQIMTAYVTAVRTLADIAGFLLKLAHTTDASAEGLLRTRQRMKVLDLLLHALPLDLPIMDVELKDIIHRIFITPGSERGVAVTVGGTSLKIPVHLAAYLALWIQECIYGIAAVIPDGAMPQVTVTFSKGASGLIIIIESGLGTEDYAIHVNPAIIDAVRSASQGTISDTIEGAMHRITFRCLLTSA